MTVDTSRIVEIEQSPGKMIFLLVLSVLMSALAVGMAWLLARDSNGSFTAFLVWVAAVFFPLCTILIVWRLFTTRGPVVTITPDGIRDTRVAAEFIPWSAIAGISTWQHSGQKVMVLAVDPVVERTLTLTAMARWTRGANRALGADGLCVTAQGLRTDYETLLKTAVEYASQRGTPQSRPA